MSCNIRIPLQQIIDDVAAALSDGFIKTDNAVLNEAVLNEVTIRGDISVDTAARNALCAILQSCGITAIELEWLDRPTVADMVAVSEVVAGDVVVSWKDLDTLITEGIVGKVQTTDVLDSLGVSQEEINTDIRNELDALPFEDGVLADTFVTAIAQGSERIARTQHQKNGDIVSVKDFGAKGDGITDDTVAFQKNATYIDDNKIPYMFIPSFDESYRISAPIRFKEPGILIKGMKGAGYDRELGKLGNIVLDATCTHGLDLSDNRSPSDVGYKGNPADGWSVRNVGVTSKGQNQLGDGIVISCNTDGPDRGGAITEVSLNYLNRGLYLPPNESSVSFAALIVQDSVLSNNNYGIYADGSTFNARIVGNQIEHNHVGGIWGRFNGATLIADNILEGQPRAITVLSRIGTQSAQPQIEVTRNYFEAQSVYAMSFTINNEYNSLYIHDNYMNSYELSLGADPLFDYIRIESGSNTVTVVNNDPFPITLMNQSSLKSSSNILSRINYYYVRSPVHGSIYYCQEIDRLATVKLDAGVTSHAKQPYRGVSENSRFGAINPWRLENATSYFEVTQTIVAGNTYHFNILYRSDGEGVGGMLQIFNDGFAAPVLSRSYAELANQSKGAWTLASIVFVAQASATKINLRNYVTDGAVTPISVAGIAVKDMGVVSPTVRNKVTPVLPILRGFDEKEVVVQVSATTVEAGETLVKDVTLSSAVVGILGMFATARQYDPVNNDIEVTAAAISDTVVRLRYKNTSASSVTLGAHSILAIFYR